MATLYFSNLPPDCSDSKLKSWVESHGLRVEWSRVLHDVAPASAPAFAYVVVEEPSQLHEIVCALDGGILDRRMVSVRKI